MRTKEKILCKKVKFEGKTLELMLRPGADESVAAEILEWREYRAAEDIIRTEKAPLLDVGAHVGLFTLMAKALNPGLKVFALEPEGDNWALLRNNLAANGLGDVKVIKAALAGASGPRRLVLEADSINHYLEAPGSEEAYRKTEKVDALSLGDFFRRYRVEELGLIKLDIEGGEYEVFEGAAPEDLSRVRNVILEYHDLPEHDHRELERLFRSRGFSVQVFPSRFMTGMDFMLARNKCGRAEKR